MVWQQNLEHIATRFGLSEECTSEIRQVLLSSFASAETLGSGDMSAPARGSGAFEETFYQAPETSSSFSPSGVLLELASPRSNVSLDVIPAEDELEAPPFPMPPRYLYEGKIGGGGMGEVFRVRDRALNHRVVMKVLREEFLARPSVVARFQEEAQITAQLDHPGIVPVHEIGQLPDSRLYFTMKEVHGSDLSAVIRSVHACACPSTWYQGDCGWNFRKLLDVFHRACEAVAYAHSRGVVHRDLKPANVMVGSFGEVLVLDWGLAKIVGSPRKRVDGGLEVDGSALHTRVGAVLGTPAYMPPEQAMGRQDRVGPASDVYALGAMLYEIIKGKAPYGVGQSREILARVLEGPPEPLEGLCVQVSKSVRVQVPEELCRICSRAMARNPEDRFADAGEFALALGEWLEGARQRQTAMTFVKEARALEPEIARLDTEAALLRAEVEVLQQNVTPDDTLEEKRHIWRLEDQVRGLEKKAHGERLRVIHLMSSALTHAPNLPSAHELMAKIFHKLHRDAERTGDPSAYWYEDMLRFHDQGKFIDYLKGEGTVSLKTSPEGAEVVLFRMEEVDRRLVPVEDRVLGVTPLVDVPLPMGSYVLEVRAEGYRPMQYPVHLHREEHWSGVAPFASRPAALPLATRQDLSEEEVYVPSGWFDSKEGQKVWVNGFVIRRDPVTVEEYLVFLNDLVRRGQGEEALRLAWGRCVGYPPPSSHPLAWIRDEQGFFRLQPDAENRWGNRPRWPVVMVDWFCASEFSAWFSRKSGQQWRLPGILEWEKAARGADGRRYPWGNYLDRSWACAGRVVGGEETLSEIGAFEVDVSVYGARGMAGNARDWCLDSADNVRRAVRHRLYEPVEEQDDMFGEAEVGMKTALGGAWYSTVPGELLSVRFRGAPATRRDGLGFRLVRPFSG